MGIRFRLILAIVMPLIISVGIVTFSVSLQFNSTAEDSFRKSSYEELSLINNYITEILKKAENTSQFVASLPETRNAVGKWTKYFELPGPSKPAEFATNPSEIRVNEIADLLMQANPDFAYVYMGFKDGGYTQDGSETIKNNYDPRIRPWYKEGKKSPTDTTLLSAYITTEGVPNIGITTKIYNPSGEFIGISAVDISLGKLTKIISDIRIGKTGYVMLIQGDGKILADPRHPDFNFKKIQELGIASLKKLFKTDKHWLEEIEIEDTQYSASVLNSDETGWKLIALIQQDEIYAASRAANINILSIGLIAAAVFALLGGYFVNRQIICPITAMVDFTKHIAAGKYDTRPASACFKAELKNLLDNMEEMVKELIKTISLADDKTKEAEVKSDQAQEALAEAEEATRRAETAKQEGMLQAARQLEEIVARIASSTTELSEQVEESRNGSERQRERASENATAMEEMNATVLEVASNAANSAENADKAKHEAEDGSKTVSAVVTAVEKLKQEAHKLGDEMGRLGSRAESIGDVMNVITDIADQTNLLALNAAIEAARAGEAGRGFAVVADEVRKLAEKTMTATKEVGEAIDSIQESSRASMKTMEETSDMVDSTTLLVGEAGSSLSSILEIIEEVAEQVRSIATAAEEQSAASEEINRSTSEINRIADENHHAMEQSTQAMQELAELSEMLNGLIEDLKNN